MGDVVTDTVGKHIEALSAKYQLPTDVIDEIHASKAEDIQSFIDSLDCAGLWIRADSLLKHPPKGVHNQLHSMRNMIEKLIKYSLYQHQILKGLLDEINRLHANYAERNGNRWSRAEDEMLVDYVAEAELNLVELSQLFGRSPTAIKNRITHLVGIKRLSTAVAGHFIGTLDGVTIEGFINGMVDK